MYIRDKKTLYNYISQTWVDTIKYLDMSLNDMEFIENNFLNLNVASDLW